MTECVGWIAPFTILKATSPCTSAVRPRWLRPDGPAVFWCDAHATLGLAGFFPPWEWHCAWLGDCHQVLLASTTVAVPNLSSPRYLGSVCRYFHCHTHAYLALPAYFYSRPSLPRPCPPSPLLHSHPHHSRPAPAFLPIQNQAASAPTHALEAFLYRPSPSTSLAIHSLLPTVRPTGRPHRCKRLLLSRPRIVISTHVSASPLPQIIVTNADGQSSQHRSVATHLSLLRPPKPLAEGKQRTEKKDFLHNHNTGRNEQRIPTLDILPAGATSLRCRRRCSLPVPPVRRPKVVVL